MSSEQYSATFRSALDNSLIRLPQCDGLNELRNNLIQRIGSDDHNPISNRQLILEPAELSQQFEVPRESIEELLSDLQRLTVVHVWVRVNCPDSGNGDPETFIETDRVSDFNKALAASCPHCARHHSSIGWEDLETFYAINFGNAAKPIRLSRFLRSPSPLPEKGRSRRPWYEWLYKEISGFFA